MSVSKEQVEQFITEGLKLPQAKINLRHLFYPGLYIRELSAPADTYLVGLVQKEAQVNIMTKGVVMVRREDGSFCELRAPQIFLGKPGRKVGYVVEDMIWLNVFATTETDVEKLEQMYIEDSPALSNHQAMLTCEASGDAFTKMVAELGYTEQQVREISEGTADVMPFPVGEYKVKIGPSLIEGKGLIATADIAEGEFICPARIGANRTPAGRYTNHSDTPNAVMTRAGSNIYLMAIRPIGGCRGGLDGDEVTIDYRQSYRLNRGD